MQHINTFGQGIKRGMDYTILPQSSYTYLLNGTLVSRDEKGFVITGVKGTIIRASFSDLETPIGSVEFNGVLYIITEKIVDSDSFICVYSLKGSDGTGWVNNMLIVPNGPDNKLEIPSELLGFSRDRLLQVFAKESYDGSVDLYICDGLNPNAVINTGLDRDGKKTDNQYKEFTHSEQFSFFKSIVKVPEVDASVESIGNLKPGTYYFYLRYEDTSLNATPFIKEIGPINIYAGEDIVVGVENENEERVSKKIVLAIYDTDPIYNKVSIAVVYYFGSDGILSRENFMIDKSISIDKTVNYFTFTGDEPLRNITTEEIIADNIPYNTSETHLQLHNRYYGANWKRGNIDYDKLKEFARRVIPRAVLHKDNNFDKYHDINNSENEYMEKEIYPFGISFLIDGSFKTPVFPVCGWREGEEIEKNYVYDIANPFSFIDVINIRANEATVQFSIVYDGDDYSETPTQMGIEWVEDQDDNKQNEYVPYADGVYEEIVITNLKKNTKYNYRIILDFGSSMFYSDIQSFTTASGEVNLDEVKVLGLDHTGATLTCEMLGYDDVDILQAAFLVSENEIIMNNGSPTGQYDTYIATINNGVLSVFVPLNNDKKYYIRPTLYISDNPYNRYMYGSEKEYQATSLNAHTYTGDATNITSSSAYIDGYCYGQDDGAVAIESGFYYSDQNSGYLYSNKIINESGQIDGNIYANLTNLNSETTYLYLVYIKFLYNGSEYINYGEIKLFDTV